MNSWLIVLAAFGNAFVSGVQTRNVAGLHFKAAFFTSWLLTVGDVAVFSAVVQRGWGALLPVGTGYSMGIVAAMLAHRRVFQQKKV